MCNTIILNSLFKIIILFFIVFFLFSVIFAEDDYDNAVSKYKNIPQNINEEISWLKPYNETYLPYNRCGEVENFEITDVDERVDYYWDSKENLFDINHYYCLVSIVRITYRVSCLNKLQYEGVSYLLSDPKKLNETLLDYDYELIDLSMVTEQILNGSYEFDITSFETKFYDVGDGLSVSIRKSDV